MAHVEKTTCGFALPTLERKVVDVATVSVRWLQFVLCEIRGRNHCSIYLVCFNDVRPTNTSRAVPHNEYLMKVLTQHII